MFPLFSKGAKTFKNKVFFLKIVQNSEMGSRFCFSISKKIVKNATVRNRLRRFGYREIERYIHEINPRILAIFSFRAKPKNDEDASNNFRSILVESKLI